MNKLSQEQLEEIDLQLREMIIKLNFDTYFIDPFDIICAMDLIEDSIELHNSYHNLPVDLILKIADLVINHCEEYSKFPLDSKEGFIESNLFFIKQIQKNKNDFINDVQVCLNNLKIKTN
jgi:hypothetical protein